MKREREIVGLREREGRERDSGIERERDSGMERERER